MKKVILTAIITVVAIIVYLAPQMGVLLYAPIENMEQKVMFAGSIGLGLLCILFPLAVICGMRMVSKAMRRSHDD